MRFLRACGVAVVALSLLSCKKKVTVELPEAAPPPAEDAAPPPTADLDAAPEAAAPLASATATAKTPVKDTSGPFVTGDIWNGTYNCRGNSALALHISSSAGNKIAAIFSFTGPKGDVGSFHQSGFYDPISRHLVLTAGAWIKQPPNFVTVNLDGFVDPGFHNYNGRVIGPGCSSFALRH